MSITHVYHDENDKVIQSFIIVEHVSRIYIYIRVRQHVLQLKKK